MEKGVCSIEKYGCSCNTEVQMGGGKKVREEEKIYTVFGTGLFIRVFKPGRLLL
ncbi:hypothetical protein ACFY5J_10950 [Peribacillus butanolivorans]|uniref:hypothetical protein n=1 Tax=Peribacillus butanolivorans TaxID=421767 RepID=UPI00369BA5CB